MLQKLLLRPDMSGLSTLLAYEEEEEEQEEDSDERHQPHQTAQATSDTEQSAHSSQPPLPPPSLPPAASFVTHEQLPLALSATAADVSESESRTESTHRQHDEQLRPTVATERNSSPPLITPPLHRLIAQLPPIPTHTLPANPLTLHSYYTNLTPHLHSLLHKRATTRTSSLIDQLISLPAFYNPAILQRILDTQRVDQHDSLWVEEGGREGEEWREEDGVQGMRRQAEREQKETERREEEERKENEAAAEQERRQRQQRDKQAEADSGQLNPTLDASLVSWRERELRKRREAAMNTATPSANITPSSSAALVSSATVAAMTDAKRQEAMRRAAEINKRLRQS